MGGHGVFSGEELSSYSCVAAVGDEQISLQKRHCAVVELSLEHKDQAGSVTPFSVRSRNMRRVEKLKESGVDASRRGQYVKEIGWVCKVSLIRNLDHSQVGVLCAVYW